MATFTYKARSLEGESIAGTLPAESEKAALAQLERMGLFPLELSTAEAQQTGAQEEKPAGGFDLARLLGPKRIGAETTARFARELADLSAAGVPILKALDAVSHPPAEGQVIWGAKESKDDVRVRELLRDVRREVSQGASLADALARRGEFFSSTAISIVRAGEEGGFLDVALRRVAVFAEREMALTRRVRGALAYPAMLCLLSGGAVVFLLTWVVPRFSTIYDDLGGALPLPTKILMAVGDGLTNYWYLFIAGALALFFGVQRVLSTEEGRDRLDSLLLRLPLLRSVIAQASIARFGRTLGTLLNSGVGILRALEIGRDAAGNREFSRRLGECVQPIREGAPLNQPLQATQLFPPQVIEMIAVGQETGTLVDVLEQVGERADEEVDHALRIFISVLEPALIVSVASVVFFVVLAALLPVFTLNTLIK